MGSGIEVKICGVTREVDVAAALDLGADYLGFILYPESPRGITASRMIQIVDALEIADRSVGVFVNMPRDDVEKIATDCGLRAVQLHGDEVANDFMDMSVPIWRVVRLGDTLAADGWNAERYVIDALAPGQYGGTGQTVDWDDAAVFARDHAVMLAGGLDPTNVSEAIGVVAPVGVDVVSGVEAEPGLKDIEKMREFIQNAKGHRAGNGQE